MSILGNRVVRVEDPRFLRGEGRYVENLELDGALAVTFVRSPLAHARVNAVDASAAAALPNVEVFTGADVDAQSLAAFIDKLPLPASARERLKALSPAQYVGLAASLARDI